MRAPDTSVLVSGFASWHESHDSAVRALRRGVALIAHTAVECYSVLTRLPPPHRVAPAVVRSFLADSAFDRYLTLDGPAHRRMIEELAAHGISGGATYDALVGLTAKSGGAVLLTHDQRAVATYERLQVDFELLT